MALRILRILSVMFNYIHIGANMIFFWKGPDTKHLGFTSHTQLHFCIAKTAIDNT